MKEQTAVEFLYDAIMKHLSHEQQMQFEGLFQQAMDMEKGQIMKAVYDSMGTNFDPNMGRAELYYNEKYANNAFKAQMSMMKNFIKQGGEK
jgi:hypothetical protein